MKDFFYSGGFLYNPKTQEVLLHHRDQYAKVNPNVWAFFGGGSEPGETPKECFMREIKEELSIVITEDQVMPLTDYLNVELDTHRNVFYVESDLPKSSMKLGEGKDFDWVPLSNLAKYDLTAMTKADLELFISKQKADKL